MNVLELTREMHVDYLRLELDIAFRLRKAQRPKRVTAGQKSWKSRRAM